MKKFNFKKQGFTLIEMMVSISIFVLVAFTITGTLIAVSNANRKAQELKQIMDNLNFSIQSMVLRMREGSRYSCYEEANQAFENLEARSLPPNGRACAGGDYGGAIAFFDPTPVVSGGSGTLVKYYLAEVEGIGGQVRHIVKVENPNIGPGPLDVTSPEVDIRGLEFKVGGISGANEKPYVIINVSGIAKLRGGLEQSEFNLQTFVSQHN